MKERPILFSTPMIKAILEERKTVTRRVMHLQPTFNGKHWSLDTGYGIYSWPDGDASDSPDLVAEICKHGYPGDILWVRETWKPENIMSHGEWQRGVRYIADNTWRQTDCPVVRRFWEKHGDKRMQPNIYLSKEASRLKLEILSIRVERLHDITEEDAIREGVIKEPIKDSANEFIWKVPAGGVASLHSAKLCFEKLWESINGQESWDSNPWIWRIEFKKL